MFKSENFPRSGCRETDKTARKNGSMYLTQIARRGHQLRSFLAEKSSICSFAMPALEAHLRYLHTPAEK